jgi:phage terminase small subunit
MGGTGRKPYSTVDIFPFDQPVERLKPPDHLGPAATRIFRDLVARVPAGQFKPSDLSLVCRWCEWTAIADRAAAEMATNDLVTPDGRPSPWIAIAERASKQLVALSLRLRLGPQSRVSKAPKTEAPGQQSYYERMVAEEDNAETGDGAVGDRS